MDIQNHRQSKNILKIAKPLWFVKAVIKWIRINIYLGELFPKRKRLKGRSSVKIDKE